MRLLLDNTLVHSLCFICEQPQRNQLRGSEALALFHLAEHILFADHSFYSTFESTRVRKTSEQVINELRREGCIPDFITPLHSTLDDYAAVCDAAALDVT